ncbi:MAG: prolyl oligopeptidase family serine peptidase, partial [Armatimonadota bacterium]
EQVTIRETRPNAAVCMCPVMELERFRAEIVPDIVGGEGFCGKARLPQASPEHRITGDEPPFLVVVGTEDVTTPLSEQQRVKQAVEEKGGSCELAVIDDAVHGAFYGITSDVQKAALPHVEAFLQNTINSGG